MKKHLFHYAFALLSALILLGVFPQNLEGHPLEDEQIEFALLTTRSLDFLDDFEKEVIAWVKQEPGHPMAFYYLSHIYLKRFELHPLNLRNLLQGLSFAEHTFELDPKSDLGSSLLLKVSYLTGDAEIQKNLPHILLDSSVRLCFETSLSFSRQEDTELFASKLDRCSKQPVWTAEMTEYLLGEHFTQDDRFPFDWTAHDKDRFQLGPTAWSQFLEYNSLPHEQKWDWILAQESKPAAWIWNHALEKTPLPTHQTVRKILPAVPTTAMIQRGLSPYASQRLKKYRWIDKMVSTNLNVLREELKEMPFDAAFLARIIVESPRTPREKNILMREIPRALKPSGTLYGTLAFWSQKLFPGLAAEYYENAILLEPHNLVQIEQAAFFFYQQKNYSQAGRHYARAIRLDPKQGKHYYNFACTMNLLGRTKEANTALKKAFQIDPRLKKIASTDKDLHGLIQGLAQSSD